MMAHTNRLERGGCWHAYLDTNWGLTHPWSKNRLGGLHLDPNPKPQLPQPPPPFMGGNIHYFWLLVSNGLQVDNPSIPKVAPLVSFLFFKASI